MRWKLLQILDWICQSLSAQGLGGGCQVIMLLLKSEWVRAVQSLKDAEVAECLSELKALFRI